MMIPKQKLPSLPSTESGFTLIECLVAIIIVSVLMVAVAPAVVISTATRVQARRVELATQAAQFYMDGLRAGRIPPPPYPHGKAMKPDLTQNPSQTNLLTTFPAPKGKGGDLIPPTPAPAGVTPTAENVYYKDGNDYPYLYCVDLDRDAGCTKGDYVVQGFRSFRPDPSNPTEPDPSDDGSLGYMLGIRVYRADAIISINGDLKTTVDPTTNSSRKMATFTGGAGDLTMPLVETTTQIRTPQTTYDSLKERLGVKSDMPSSSPSP